VELDVRQYGFGPAAFGYTIDGCRCRRFLSPPLFTAHPLYPANTIEMMPLADIGSMMVPEPSTEA
jgi:hypothetical protein